LQSWASLHQFLGNLQNNNIYISPWGSLLQISIIGDSIITGKSAYLGAVHITDDAMSRSDNNVYRDPNKRGGNKPCLSRNIEFPFYLVKPLLWYWYFPSMQTSVPSVAQSILAARDPFWASPLSSDSCLEPAPSSTTTCNTIPYGIMQHSRAPNICKSGPEVGPIYAGNLVCNMWTGYNWVPPSRPGSLRTRTVALTQRVLFDKTPV